MRSILRAICPIVAVRIRDISGRNIIKNEKSHFENRRR